MYQLLAENLILYKAHTNGEEDIFIQRKVLHYYTTFLIVHLQIFGTLKETEKTIKDRETKRCKRSSSEQHYISAQERINGAGWIS